jgi:hypothetical protein
LNETRKSGDALKSQLLSSLPAPKPFTPFPAEIA